MSAPHLSRFIQRSCLLAAWWASVDVGEVSAEQASSAATAPTPRTAADGSITTRRDARTITLRIPAPRGMITDREGEPLAQNIIAYQVALQFQQFEQADREFVVSWARARLTSIPSVSGGLVSKSDDELYDHYRHRRWLPLLISGQIDEGEARRVEAQLPAGVQLHPVYRRHYPHGECAAHIIGYTGSVGRLPTGPINFNEPMWEESEGRAGLEKIHDARLAGEPGIKKLLFDEFGNKLLEEQVRRPRAGGTVVTTLDFKWQMLAEEILRKGCRRGAFVVIDIATGEVLVLASRPSFDLNRFIPGIGEADFKELSEDPSTPLYGRAFQSAYPPASSFKPVVALAALRDGHVTENTLIDCPAAISIGRTVFNNWSRAPEGPIDVKRAIARSCNTWFYRVGIDIGSTSFLGLARRLGFGESTGLPLVGETSGLVPNDDWMLRHHKRRILAGDVANLSIGQGALLASPLQVAQAMAGIANGDVLPKLRLVRQVQDMRGRVVDAPLPDRRNSLGLDPLTVEIVRNGMSDVVNTGYGTGRSAGLGFTTLCGKTGTAQWGPKSKNQRLAWFAGFLPRDNPRYAFAVLYEGRPGERVSGGRMAAPMVRNFFQGIREDIKESIEPPRKALVVAEESEEVVVAAPAATGEEQALSNVPRAIPAELPTGDEAIAPDDDEVMDENIEEP
jgi:penicillin-binding protein 2